MKPDGFWENEEYGGPFGCSQIDSKTG